MPEKDTANCRNGRPYVSSGIGNESEGEAITQRTQRGLSRRALLGAMAVIPLAACTTAPPTVAGTTSAPKPPATPALTPAPLRDDTAFQSLERQFGARLGVWAVDTGTGDQISYRADERFPFCSTAKTVLAAMILHTRTSAELDEIIHYSRADLIAHSPITMQNLAASMTIRALCEAAMRYSDNSAANLLYVEVGGPSALQRYARDLGDTTTNMARIEPDLNFAVPNDPRDTTTPEVWGRNYQRILLGDALEPAKRDTLLGWMHENTTGDTLIRKAAPAGWKVADKTGSGWYGVRNDIAVVTPPNAASIVVGLMSSKSARSASIDDELIAQAAGIVFTALT